MKREPMSKECIVVASQDETGVYVTEGGYVAIRQNPALDDPQVVLLAPQNVAAVIAAMKECVKEAEQARTDYLFGGEDE